MSSATLWVVLAAVGFGCLLTMKHTGKAWIDAVLIRVSSAAFLAAGTIGARGWIGGFLHGVVTTTNSVGTEVSRSAAGTSVVWILGVAAAFATLLTWMPESWFKKDIPDWLATFGLLLPSFLAAAPGPLGTFFRGLVDAVATPMIDAVSRLLGG